MSWLDRQVCRKHKERKQYSKERKKWICETCDWEKFEKKYGRNHAVIFTHKPYQEIIE